MKLFEALIDTVNTLIYASCFWLILTPAELEIKYSAPISVIIAVFYYKLYNINKNTTNQP